MPSRRVVAVLLASAALVALAGCTSAPPTPNDTPAVTAPQPDISGEWVVTRTVTASNDAANPARAVGATSVRYVLVEREDCDEALCEGTVTSGETLEQREETALTQTDGGFDYEFSGSLDCMNTATGGVLVVDGFDYTQEATLQATSTDGETADALTGTLVYTDAVTEKALAAGCTRDPLAVEITYALAATRAP